MPRLLIILASTRPGRGGEAVADWCVPLAREAMLDEIADTERALRALRSAAVA